jgi:signal transduction histidine kinase
LKAIKVTIALAFLVGLGAPAWSAGQGTKDECMALVKKAVALIKADGPQKAYAEFDQKPGPFVDRDLYILVYGLNGHVLAHGANAKLIGKDMSDAQDVDGKYYVKERVTLAAKQPSFWQDYKFANPVSKKIEPKEAYCERVSDTVVCSGVYKH